MGLQAFSSGYTYLTLSLISITLAFLSGITKFLAALFLWRGWLFHQFAKTIFFRQVLLAMRANVEDRGMKGDCTPLMEAASAGHTDIVKLLIGHCADVNAQSSSGEDLTLLRVSLNSCSTHPDP